MGLRDYVERLLTGGGKRPRAHTRPAEGKTPAQEQKLSERRRYDRVPVGSADIWITFPDILVLHAEVPIVRGRVTNLSHRGLKAVLERPDDVSRFAPGRPVEARLYLEPERGVPLWLRPVRVMSGGELGFEIMVASQEAQEALNLYLEPRFLGLSLREIQGLKAESSDKSMRWFQGKNGTNLFQWEVEGNVVAQQLVFVDYVVEWESGKPLRMGELSREHLGYRPGYGRIDPHVIVFYDVPSEHIVRLGEALLSSAPLDQEVLEPLLDRLKDVERRFHERCPVPAHEDVRLFLSPLPETGAALAAVVTDISDTGAGLRVLNPEAALGVPMGQDLDAALFVGRHSETITVRLVRRMGDQAGVEFGPPSDAFKTLVAPLLAPPLPPLPTSG